MPTFFPIEDMEQQFDLGITWAQFGNARNESLTFLFNENNLTGAQRIILDDLWANHPNRQQGKISLITFFMLFIFRIYSHVVYFYLKVNCVILLFMLFKR